MADCDDNLTGIGRGMLISWSPGCGSDDPKLSATTPLTYKKLGYMQTRSENDTFRSDTVNTDESGSDSDVQVFGIDSELSLSFLDAKDATDVTTQQELRAYFRAEVKAGRQPTAWYRVTDPLLEQYRYYFCQPASSSRSSENESRRTGEFTLTKTSTRDATNDAYQEEDFPV